MVSEDFGSVHGATTGVEALPSLASMPPRSFPLLEHSRAVIRDGQNFICVFCESRRFNGLILPLDSCCLKMRRSVGRALPSDVAVWRGVPDLIFE